MKACIFGLVNGFVVGNGGSFGIIIDADGEIAVEVEKGFVGVAAKRALPLNAVVGIDDFDIGIAKVRIIPVDKTVVPVLDGKGTDAVSSGYCNLRTVVSHEKMTAPAHDAVPGIVEEVLTVEGQTIGS